MERAKVCSLKRNYYYATLQIVLAGGILLNQLTVLRESMRPSIFKI
jgi:hypothetical protein